MNSIEFTDLFQDRTNPDCFWGDLQVGPVSMHLMAVAVVKDTIQLQAFNSEFQHWLDHIMALDNGEYRMYNLFPYRWRNDVHDYRRHYFIFAIPFQGVCS